MSRNLLRKLTVTLIKKNYWKYFLIIGLFSFGMFLYFKSSSKYFQSYSLILNNYAYTEILINSYDEQITDFTITVAGSINRICLAPPTTENNNGFTGDSFRYYSPSPNEFKISYYMNITPASNFKISFQEVFSNKKLAYNQDINLIIIGDSSNSFKIDIQYQTFYGSWQWLTFLLISSIFLVGSFLILLFKKQYPIMKMQDDLEDIDPDVVIIVRESIADESDDWRVKIRVALQGILHLVKVELLAIAQDCYHLPVSEDPTLLRQIIAREDFQAESGLRNAIFLKKMLEFIIFEENNNDLFSNTMTKSNAFSVIKLLSMLIKKIKQIPFNLKKAALPPDLISNEQFWRKFIQKTKNHVEMDFFDFKETLEMWKVDKKLRDEMRLIFCEHIAAFANAQGGVIIIGIDNNLPRTIIGLDDIEKKREHIITAIHQFGPYEHDYVVCQPITIQSVENIEKSCLIIAIKQTKKPLGIRHRDDKFTYPRREGSDKRYFSYEEISKFKELVKNDNFDFLNILEHFVNNL